MQQMQQMQEAQHGQRWDRAVADDGMGMGGGMGQPDRKKSGKDMRKEDRAKEPRRTEKAIDKTKGPSLFDPYFDIVQVKVYGQARFYNPPPAEAAADAEHSASGGTPAPAAAGRRPAKDGETQARPAAAKPAEKAGAAQGRRRRPQQSPSREGCRPRGRQAERRPPTAKPNSEKRPSTESGSATSKPAQGRRPAAQDGPGGRQGLGNRNPDRIFNRSRNLITRRGDAGMANANAIVEKLKDVGLRHGEKAGVAIASTLFFVCIGLAAKKETINTTPEKVKAATQGIRRAISTATKIARRSSRTWKRRNQGQ